MTSHTGSTRDGGWVGTLGYVAPEQIRGERLDARADVYALGCVLYHSLAGVPPYQRESDEATLWAHLNDDPPSLHDRAPDVPASFDAVLARAMAKDPDDRFPSAGDLGRAALAAAGEPVAPGPERVVAVGEAAPGDRQETVVSPRPGADRAAASAPARGAGCGRGRWPLVPIAGLALIAALALGGGDGGGGGERRRRRRRLDGHRHDQAAAEDGDQERRRRRAPQQHRAGQRQGVGRAQRQRRGWRSSTPRPPSASPTARASATRAARPPASASCG